MLRLPRGTKVISIMCPDCWSSSLAKLGFGGEARGVPCYPRYLSDSTISANRCAIAAHRADTSENDSHKHVGCSDAGRPATNNALQFEWRLVGSDLEGDRSRAGRLRPPHRELQRSNHIGHTEGETFACWAPCWLMMQRACAGTARHWRADFVFHSDACRPDACINVDDSGQFLRR